MTGLPGKWIQSPLPRLLLYSLLHVVKGSGLRAFCNTNTLLLLKHVCYSTSTDSCSRGVRWADQGLCVQGPFCARTSWCTDRKARGCAHTFPRIRTGKGGCRAMKSQYRDFSGTISQKCADLGKMGEMGIRLRFFTIYVEKWGNMV